MFSFEIISLKFDRFLFNAFFSSLARKDLCAWYLFQNWLNFSAHICEECGFASKNPEHMTKHKGQHSGDTFFCYFGLFLKLLHTYCLFQEGAIIHPRRKANWLPIWEHICMWEHICARFVTILYLEKAIYYESLGKKVGLNYENLILIILSRPVEEVSLRKVTW